MMTSNVETGRITTNIPARMDRLPWSRWHWLVVVGLGTVWILDGIEVGQAFLYNAFFFTFGDVLGVIHLNDGRYSPV